MLESGASLQASPVWSPDGGKIAFGGDGIWVVNADGTDLVQVTDTSGFLLGWSPNGNCLAVFSLPGGESVEGESYVISVDASYRLTLLTLDQGGFSWHPLAGFFPNPWSPDGTRLAFVSPETKLDFYLTGPFDPEGVEIGVVNADGTGRRTITDDGGFKIVAGWAPQGDMIAFIHFDSDVDLDAGVFDFDNGGIYVVSSDGSGRTRLAELPDIDGGLPFWSPDGKRLAFWLDVDGRGSLYVINADGSDLTPLTDGACDGLLGVSWSPDGQRLAFVQSCGEPYWSADQRASLWVVGLDGPGPTLLLEGIDDGLEPTWSPVR